MPDTVYTRTYDESVESRYGDAEHLGAVSLIEEGPQVFTNVAEISSATVYDCYGAPQLSIAVDQAVSLIITRTPTQVTVNFTLSTVVDVDYSTKAGGSGHFSGTLALVGELTFDPRTFSCADLKTYCGDQRSWCGDGYGGSSATTGGYSGFNVDVDSAYTFLDGTALGNGALIVDDNRIDMFAGVVVAGDGAQGAPSVYAGALALGFLLSGDEPFEGISPMDMILIKAIGAAAAMMSANPTEAGAQAATLLATYTGIATVLDYIQTSLAVADVTPGNVSLAASSDSGAKGDGLTNDRTVTITGVAGKYAAVTLLDGDKVVATGRADGAGTFTLTSTALADGTHSLTVVGKDAAGISGASDAVTVTVDSKAPAASVGAVSAQGVSGLAEAGAKVAVYDGSTLIGTTTAGDDGKWSLAANLGTKSVHAVTARATDAAGNSATSEATLFGSYFGKLTGTGEDDVLVATPDTTLTGGYGKDLFVFEGAWGKSAVSDFRPGWDKVQVDDALADTWAELKAIAKQQGADVVITLDPTHAITLKNVALSSLSAGDFLFG
ncbi:Ig-like domain-containing protein [Phenylobacterium sp.]|uniref:Ig-like domain-containing protein n=1 Tax=Phenylobacterium sp. TaxID=1871053 RepID=UPI002F9453E7